MPHTPACKALNDGFARFSVVAFWQATRANPGLLALWKIGVLSWRRLTSLGTKFQIQTKVKEVGPSRMNWPIGCFPLLRDGSRTLSLGKINQLKTLSLLYRLHKGTLLAPDNTLLLTASAKERFDLRKLELCLTWFFWIKDQYCKVNGMNKDLETIVCFIDLFELYTSEGSRRMDAVRTRLFKKRQLFAGTVYYRRDMPLRSTNCLY